MTQTHEVNNLHYDNALVIDYSKSKISESFNGYEAGTSIVKKSVLESIGQDGCWSWEETVYPKLSGDIHAYIDNTPFWDIGTPERLAKLEQFFKECGR